MKVTIGVNDFLDAWRTSTRDKQFSYEGKLALFEMFEEVEDDIGEEIELDIIGICCEFAEYINLAAVLEDYKYIETMEDLKENTAVIEFDGGIIIQVF